MNRITLWDIPDLGFENTSLMDFNGKDVPHPYRANVSVVGNITLAVIGMLKFCKEYTGGFYQIIPHGDKNSVNVWFEKRHEAVQFYLRWRNENGEFQNCVFWFVF